MLDAAESPLPTPIYSSLRNLVNLLLAGQAPNTVARFLAGASLTALNKNKPDQPRDIRPIAVGETLRRIAGICLCAVVKCKASDFFLPLQVGVKAHSNDDDFYLLKIDLRNAFNLVSWQTFLNECAAHFSEVLPWTLWCYGQHPVLWHPLGLISSESGVQQGNPLGPLLFSLVLQSFFAIASNCQELLFHMWYLDDGAIAGPKLAVHSP